MRLAISARAPLSRIVAKSSWAGADRLRGDCRQRLPADEHVARAPVEPRATARLAGAGAEVPGEIVADHARLGLPVPALHVGEHPFERVLAGVVPPAFRAEREADGLGAAAVQDDVAHRGRKVAERSVDIEPVVRGERLDHLEVVEVATVPAADRPAGEAQLGMGDDTGRVEERLHTESVTAFAWPRPGC